MDQAYRRAERTPGVRVPPAAKRWLFCSHEYQLLAKDDADQGVAKPEAQHVGEGEFWLTLINVLTVIVFLIAGVPVIFTAILSATDRVELFGFFHRH